VRQKARLPILCMTIIVLALSGCGVSEEPGKPDSEAASLQHEPETSAKVEPAPELALPEQSAGVGKGLQNVPNITVTQAYIFDSKKWGDIVWTLEIPLHRYIYYRERPRPENFAQYVNMATDAYDDDIVDAIIQSIKETAATKNLSRTDQLSLVLTFVQSMTYAEDIVTTYQPEYPRYPVETLYEKIGDCEDTSILAAAILTRMGYDVALLLFEKFDHMGVGVNYPLEYGNSWIYEGKRYWYFDTAGGRSVGWSPDEYGKTAAYVMPVKE